MKNSKIKVSKKEYRSLCDLLGFWKERELVSEQQQRELMDSVEVKQFHWQNLARYCFRAAIGSLFIAVMTILMDDELLALIRQLFNTPLLVKSGFFLLLSLGLVGWGARVRRLSPAQVVSYKTLFILGMLGVATSIYFLGAYLDSGTEHFPPLILLCAAIYIVLGWLLTSGMIWGWGLVALGFGVVLETGFLSGWERYFMGMNYSLRFLLVGLAGLCFSYGIKIIKPALFKQTQALALLCGFIALWLLSLNANTEDLDFAGHRQVVPWVIGFALAAIMAIVAGAKAGDNMLRGFGLAFLAVNLYTRYFEYLVGEVHEALFFTILAASFWLISRYAEKLWLFGK